ncbi:MAG: hypothetical protein K2M05_07015 [Paramuribaculum sp.]|nr:hypothetical protein [Paramuribaculum sp.]MDE6304456.1 hypothetical protein [Paramuribaculum sp.]
MTVFRLLAVIVVLITGASGLLSASVPMPRRVYVVDRPRVIEPVDTLCDTLPVLAGGSIIIEMRGRILSDRKGRGEMSKHSRSTVWGRNGDSIYTLAARLRALSRDELTPQYEMELTLSSVDGEKRVVCPLPGVTRSDEEIPLTMELDFTAKTVSAVAGSSEKPALTVAMPQKFIPLVGASATDATAVSLLVAEILPDESKEIARLYESEDELRAVALSYPVSGVAGLWQYFDRDTDDRYLRTGGNYTLAVIPTLSANEYDIVYVSGAKVNSLKWLPGMLKGKLLGNGFINSWTLEAVDASFHDMEGENHASMTQDGAILTLTFPELKSTLRFRRLVK